MALGQHRLDPVVRLQLGYRDQRDLGRVAAGAPRRFRDARPDIRKSVPGVRHEPSSGGR